MRSYFNIPVPPGEYFMGDPCYAFQASSSERSRIISFIEKAEKEDSVVIKYGASYFIAFERGDGQAKVIGPDIDGYKTLASDSGLLGLVPKELWGVGVDVRKLEELGQIIRINHPTMFKKVDDVVVCGKYAFDFSFYDTDYFVNYDHDVDNREVERGEEDPTWNMWGQYDRDGGLLSKGISMKEAYWINKEWEYKTSSVTHRSAEVENELRDLDAAYSEELRKLDREKEVLMQANEETYKTPEKFEEFKLAFQAFFKGEMKWEDVIQVRADQVDEYGKRQKNIIDTYADLKKKYEDSYVEKRMRILGY